MLLEYGFVCCWYVYRHQQRWAACTAAVYVFCYWLLCMLMVFVCVLVVYFGRLAYLFRVCLCIKMVWLRVFMGYVGVSRVHVCVSRGMCNCLL